MKVSIFIKKVVIFVLVACLSLVMVACDGSSKSNKCGICGGTGYYQKKDCPGCP